MLAKGSVYVQTRSSRICSLFWVSMSWLLSALMRNPFGDGKMATGTILLTSKAFVCFAALSVCMAHVSTCMQRSCISTWFPLRLHFFQWKEREGLPRTNQCKCSCLRKLVLLLSLHLLLRRAVAATLLPCVASYSTWTSPVGKAWLQLNSWTWICWPPWVLQTWRPLFQLFLLVFWLPCSVKLQLGWRRTEQKAYICSWCLCSTSSSLFLVGAPSQDPIPKGVKQVAVLGLQMQFASDVCRLAYHVLLRMVADPTMVFVRLGSRSEL